MLTFDSHTAVVRERMLRMHHTIPCLPARIEGPWYLNHLFIGPCSPKHFFSWPYVSNAGVTTEDITGDATVCDTGASNGPNGPTTHHADLGDL